MRWFRDTIRQGTWLALIALAINLGLSFGHFHAIEGLVSGHGIVATTIASTDDVQKQGHPSDSHADYLCPICMAATAMASPLASPPPALVAEFDYIAFDRRVVSVVAVAESPRAAFQSRGPPIS